MSNMNVDSNVLADQLMGDTHEQLRASEERYRELVDNVRDVVWSVHFGNDPLRSPTTFVSRQAQETLGYSPDDFFRDSELWVRCIHPDDMAAMAKSMTELSAGSPLLTRIYRFRHGRSGAYRWIEDRVAARRNLVGELIGLFGVARDITERIDAETDRKRLESQLLHTQKLESLGIMAGGIAHDFNNLLTGILGYCDLAQMELPVNSAARNLIGEAIKGVRSAAQLANQMLAYSGKGVFLVEPIILSDLIEDMVRILQVSISKKCVTKFNFLPNLPAIMADGSQIRQIVMNLVINASEAISDQNGLITISTGIMHCDRTYLVNTYDDQFLPEGMYVYLEVADTGCGMSQETLTKIFDPFYTTKFVGRGLGLSAVLGIVRGHQGTIKCYTQLNKGTTFKVLFPLSDRSAISPKPEFVGDHWKAHGTVLIVDDEEMVLSTARQMLTSMGFNILTAPDGRAAIEVFQQNHSTIRLTLLDMTMPHFDGVETFRELRREQAELPVILMSGYSEQSVTNQFAGKGLAGFLQKPFQFVELRAVIRRALGEESPI
ncbi:MAG: hybrid sensor histidine kinase/response regulator [Fimbriiglobus sp.]